MKNSSISLSTGIVASIMAGIGITTLYDNSKSQPLGHSQCQRGVWTVLYNTNISYINSLLLLKVWAKKIELFATIHTPLALFDFSVYSYCDS